jgi:hypothetical protein
VQAHSSEFKGLFFFVIIVMGIAVRSSATVTQESINFGANLGTLDYTVSTQAETCTSEYGLTDYTIYTFNNLVFHLANNTTQQINNETWWDVGVGGRIIGSGDCPDDPSGGVITYVASGNAYTITMTPHNNGAFSAAIAVPGYINPKYIVLGVIYAPPGHKSYVDYTDSTLVSSTVTTKNSFGSGFTETSAVTENGNLLYGFQGGSLTVGVTASTSWTENTTTIDSTAYTVQKTTSTSLQVPGPICDYCGVDHDYDLIAVWLNPVQLITLGSGGSGISGIAPNGYGFSTYDQPGVDVYYVYAGELNGQLPVRSSTKTAFARSWASILAWPSGQGPALTSQDKENILQLDPYWNCTYKSAINNTTACPEPPDTTRFTQSTNSSFPYQEPAAGGQPITKPYSWSYSTTDTQGTDVTSSVSETTGIEETFDASLFGFGYKATLSQSWSTNYTYETSSQFTSTNTSTAAVNITGPGCTVVKGACSPQYPPPHAYDPITCAALTLATSFGQGDNMYIYQDNLFGTFLLEPYGQ